MTLDKSGNSNGSSRNSSSNNNNNNNNSGCPVSKDGGVDASFTATTTGWGSWLGWIQPKKASSKPISTSLNGCPVTVLDDDKEPASLEEAAGHEQTPQFDQKGVVLNTHRVISSIPRGVSEEKGPHHQPAGDDTCKDDANSSGKPSRWIYPSEQQFFNALRKKGWDHVEAHEIPTVLEIHNTVNEKTWKQVLRWEEGMDRDTAGSAVETDLKLVRFQGKPTELSPQAFIWTKILRWMDPPFDRHDWYVRKQPRTRTDGVTNSFPIQRYVIDYYMIPPQHPEMPPTPYVDARPALDSPRAFYLRALRLIQQELPGVTSEYQAWKARQRAYFDGSLPDK